LVRKKGSEQRLKGEKGSHGKAAWEKRGHRGGEKKVCLQGKGNSYLGSEEERVFGSSRDVLMEGKKEKRGGLAGREVCSTPNEEKEGL